MAKMKIRLGSISEVREFNSLAATLPGDVDLHSGRYCIDAKSIMGIFSLDLSQPLTVEAALPEAELQALFAPFAVK